MNDFIAMKDWCVDEKPKISAFLAFFVMNFRSWCQVKYNIMSQEVGNLGAFCSKHYALMNDSMHDFQKK